MPHYRRESARPRLQSGTAIGAAVAMGSLTLATLALPAQPARATTINDPTGDILSTFNGPHTGPSSGQYDVSSVSAVQNGVDVTISATMAGPATRDGLCALWINRGKGDGVLGRRTDAGGRRRVVRLGRDTVPGGRQLRGPVTGEYRLAAFAHVTRSLATASPAVIPFADLPATGFTTSNYLFNLWLRDGLVTTDNTEISDFAPNASSFAASAAPEPSVWALMLTGLGMLGAALMKPATEGPDGMVCRRPGHLSWPALSGVKLNIVATSGGQFQLRRHCFRSAIGRGAAGRRRRWPKVDPGARNGRGDTKSLDTPSRSVGAVLSRHAATVSVDFNRVEAAALDCAATSV